MSNEIILDNYLAVYLDVKKRTELKEESFEKRNEQSSQPLHLYEEILEKREPEKSDIQVEQVNHSQASSQRTHSEINQFEHKAQVNNVGSEEEKLMQILYQWIKRFFDLDEVSFQDKIQQFQQKSNSIYQQNLEFDKSIIQEIEKNKNESCLSQDSILQNLEFRLNSQVKQQQLKGLQIVKTEEVLKIKQNTQEKEKIEQIESLCFNKDDTLIAVSDLDKIKIFKFEEGKMIEIDQIKVPQLKINCLQFMKHQNVLISGGGGGDYNICIIQQSNDNKWIPTKKCQNPPITCMITNQEETILFAGDEHGSVGKWNIKSENGIKCIFQDVGVHGNTVYGISLNTSQTKMVTCSKQKKGSAGGIVLVWGEVQGPNPLNKIATIEFENFGCRILYTGEEQILFSLKEQGLLQFIVKDGKIQNKKLIIGMKSSIDYYLFPMQYNEKQNIGVCKQGDRVYLFKKNNQNDFELLKELEPLKVNDIQNNIKINGALSNNGKWLVIQNQNELHTYQILV